MDGVAKAAILAWSLLGMATAHAQNGSPGTGQPLAVAMLVEGSRQDPVSLVGRTNLPDGSRLTLSMNRVQPPCQSACGFTIPALIVSGGEFLVADQSTLKQVGPGSYQVEVLLQGAGQPDGVSAIIGKLGENLRGPLIVTTNAPGQYSRATFPRPAAPSMGERALGLMVRYLQIVDLSEMPRANPGIAQAKGTAKSLPAAFDPASCRGTRSQLPIAYQDRCRSLDVETRTYTPDWRPLGSDKSGPKIDVNSILRGTGGAEAVVYTGTNTYDPSAEQKLIFDCQGHYLVAGPRMTMLDARPGTVAGSAAAIACRAKVNTARP